MKNLKSCWAEVDLKAIRHNIKQIRNFVGKDVKVMPVIKAEAYGHGLIEVARAYQEEGIDAFGIATVEEGIRLRQKEIGGLILVLYDTPLDKIEDALKNNLSFSLYSKEFALALSKEAKRQIKKAKVHLAIDTGMNWYGLSPEEVLGFAKEVLSRGNIEIEGLYSHLSQADSNDPNKTYTKNQIKKFCKIIRDLEKNGIRPIYRHIANSAATLLLPKSHFNMIRPGLMLYGVYPNNIDRLKVKLKPAFSFKTKIIQIRTIPKGESIGYGGTFVTSSHSKIAILPVGYSDGISRSLSNKGKVIIRSKRFPIIGNICMNIMMIDVSGSNDIKTGDEVTILGSEENETISADEIAKDRNTISYEVLTDLGINNQRIYK